MGPQSMSASQTRLPTDEPLTTVLLHEMTHHGASKNRLEPRTARQMHREIYHLDRPCTPTGKVRTQFPCSIVKAIGQMYRIFQTQTGRTVLQNLALPTQNPKGGRTETHRLTKIVTLVLNKAMKLWIEKEAKTHPGPCQVITRQSATKTWAANGYPRIEGASLYRSVDRHILHERTTFLQTAILIHNRTDPAHEASLMMFDPLHLCSTGYLHQMLTRTEEHVPCMIESITKNQRWLIAWDWI